MYSIHTIVDFQTNLKRHCHFAHAGQYVSLQFGPQLPFTPLLTYSVQWISTVWSLISYSIVPRRCSPLFFSYMCPHSKPCAMGVRASQAGVCASIDTQHGSALPQSLLTGLVWQQREPVERRHAARNIAESREQPGKCLGRKGGTTSGKKFFLP